MRRDRLEFVVARSHPFGKATEAKRGWFVRSHVINVTGGADLVVQAESPVTGVDQQPAQAGTLQIHRGSHRRTDNARLLAGLAGVLFRPDERHHRLVLGALDRGIVCLHAGHDLSVDQHLGVLGQVADPVHVGRSPNVTHAGQDRVRFEFRVQNAPRAFPTMMSVVVDPRVSQDLLPKTARPALTVVAVVCVGAFSILGVIERVRGGP